MPILVIISIVFATSISTDTNDDDPDVNGWFIVLKVTILIT